MVGGLHFVSLALFVWGPAIHMMVPPETMEKFFVLDNSHAMRDLTSSLSACPPVYKELGDHNWRASMARLLTGGRGSASSHS